MKSLVDPYTDRYRDPRRGQVVGVAPPPNGQAIESDLELRNALRKAGDALGLDLTPGELLDFSGKPRKEPAKRTLPALLPDGSIDWGRFITHTFGTPLDEIEKNEKRIEDMYKSGEFEIEPYREKIPIRRYPGDTIPILEPF